MYTHQVLHSGQIHLWEAKGDAEQFEGRVSHCHKEYEIYYMFDGEADFTIEGQEFHVVSDSLMLIPSNVFHQWTYPPGRIHHRMTLHFFSESLDKTMRAFFTDMFTEPLHFLNGARNNLRFFFQAIVDCEKMPAPLQEIAIESRMVTLLTQIYFLKSTHAIQPVIVDERIRKIINYLGQHLVEEITLDQLSDKFAITKNHLNFLFRKVVGTPIMKYITIKRLQLARQEIQNGARIGEVAYFVGFKDYTTFYRSYKSFYGYSPSVLSASHTDPAKIQL